MASSSPAEMSVTPSEDSFLIAVLSPGIILDADIPAASIFAINAIASSIPRPIAWSCGAKLMTLSANPCIDEPEN